MILKAEESEIVQAEIMQDRSCLIHESSAREQRGLSSRVKLSLEF